ncbi:protein PIGBOS1-like [Cariama cristata]
MWGRLPLPHVALAVALGVASGLYIYRPIFQPPTPQQPPEGTAGSPADAAPGKRP